MHIDTSSSTSAQSGKQGDAYTNIAGLAILAYDYCLTIDQEVNLVWTRRWDVVQVIYMVARYLPFPAVALTVSRVRETVANEPCPNVELSDSLHVTSVVFAELLLILRTVAFWDRNRPIVWTLTILALFCLAGAMGLTQIAYVKVPDVRTTSQDNCTFGFNRGAAVEYGFLMLHELVILCLILYRWLSYHRHARSRIVVISYIDAVAYIIAMLSLSAACIVDITAEPVYHNDYFDNLQVVGHSIFCARTFFHLRKSAEYQSRHSTTETPLEDMTAAVELTSILEGTGTRNERSFIAP